MAGDYNTKCGVQVNYQSVGSGAGVKDWQQNTVDFGASDAYLSDADMAVAATNGAPVEVPTTFGAVVVAYNLTGLSAPIKMTPDIIAGIFLGKIATWNDPALATANPGVSLPSTAISVVHRSDGSGTTSIFTNYLTAVSPAWVTTVGLGDPTKSAGKTVTWPVGQGASGNEGVTQGIKGTDGGVGYIDVAYAIQNQIPFADVQNKSGNSITPSLASIAAAANLPSYPADLRFNLVNTAAAQGYPIAGTTWIIVYKDLSKVMKSQDRANALVDFIWMPPLGVSAIARIMARASGSCSMTARPTPRRSSTAHCPPTLSPRTKASSNRSTGPGHPSSPSRSDAAPGTSSPGRCIDVEDAASQ